MAVSRLWRMAISAGVLCLLAACGGGGGGGDDGGLSPGGAGGPSVPAPAYPPVPPTDADAARFLTQATFGVTRADIQRVREIGYSRWIDEQIAAPSSSMLGYLQQLETAGVLRDDMTQQMRRNYWLWRAATGPDQLRLRMGLALSEIMVVSDREVADSNRTVYRLADYQDTLARNAFGSYRTLIGDVSRHPAMGYYLSHVGNRKTDVARNIFPDENYGREIMQLFSIGLVQLNQDGTPKLDAAGNTVPTYDEAVVSAMARVFTGWTYAGQTDAQYGRNENYSYAPMECHPAFHDDQAKTIFDGVVVAAGNDCAASLAATLDALSRHANTAPYISRQLIQRFVTSNPSPAYVGRVAQAWTRSGGNLGEVIKAVLLDAEARVAPTDPAFGKAREPLVKLATLWRTFGAQHMSEPSGRLNFRFSNAGDLTVPIAQDALRAPSVFNFFEPGYRLPGANGTEGIQAPEFQILTEANYTSTLNQHDSLVWTYSNTGAAPTQNEPAPFLNLGPLVTLVDAKDYAGAIQELNVLLFYGQLSEASKATLLKMSTDLAAANNSSINIARSLVLASLAAPEFAVQR